MLEQQHFDETYSLNGPENYERFFVPAIGKPLAEDLVDLANFQPGQRVLDVACGTGVVARLAHQKVGPSGSVAGLDANPGMLAVARSVSENSSIEWYEASAEAIPFPDNSFDVILCQLGLQFMEDKIVALQEMRRVLVTGGDLLFNVPGPSDEIFAILAKAMEHNISGRAAGFVTKVFSLHNTSEIQQLMSEAGFKETEVNADNKTLRLPEPKEFLWQYVFGTPLAAEVLAASEESRIALENEVLAGWHNFAENGGLYCKQRVVTARAQK